MATNLAAKFSPKVDERFKLASLTEATLSNDYDWDGVDKVNVYSIDVADLNDYNMAATGEDSRYGALNEVGDKVQSMALTQDKSFRFAIDKRNKTSQMMVKDGNKHLRRIVDEKIIPYIDTYRISTYVAAAVANGGVATGAVDKTNAFETFLTGRKYLVDHKVPATGRFCYAGADFINKIQLDARFNLNSDKAMDSNVNGFAGKASGVTFIEVPVDYLPANTDFVLVHKSAMVSPQKLQDYNLITDTDKLDGWIGVGRNLFDAFVLNSKVNSIYAHKTPAA